MSIDWLVFVAFSLRGARMLHAATASHFYGAEMEEGVAPLFVSRIARDAI